MLVYLLGHLLVWTIILVNLALYKPLRNSLDFLLAGCRYGAYNLETCKIKKAVRSARSPSLSPTHDAILEIRFMGRGRDSLQSFSYNSFLVMISAPQIFGVLFWRDTGITLFVTVVAVFLFITTYVIGINFAKKLR